MAKEKEPTNAEILKVINKFSTNVDGRFETIEGNIAEIKNDVAELKSNVAGLKGDVNKIKATMVTKDYLDDKLADLRGDLVVLTRKEDTKLKTLIEILQERKLITEQDTKRILSMEPFPQLFLQKSE